MNAQDHVTGSVDFGGIGWVAQQFEKCVAACIVVWVPVLICVARSLSACMVVSSAALAKHGNFPVICWRWSFCFGDNGAELSIAVSWTFAPQFGGAKGDGECCDLVGFGCWNCKRARLTWFFMLVLSVLSLWFQSRSMPTHLEPDQSVLMG